MEESPCDVRRGIVMIRIKNNRIRARLTGYGITTVRAVHTRRRWPEGPFQKRFPKESCGVPFLHRRMKQAGRIYGGLVA